MKTNKFYLIDTGVVQHNEPRFYSLGNKPLKGITGMISKHLFPNKFDAVPERVLKTATERGSAIHKDIQSFEIFGIIKSEYQKEIENYVFLKKQKGFKVINTEYIVTDFEKFASPIDTVVTIDDKIILVDIKTTYTLDKEYLSWQLSILKYLFELTNPTLKVSGLASIWINRKDDTAEWVDIAEIEQNHIKELMRCEIAKEPFINPFAEIVFKGEDKKALLLIQAISDIATEIKTLQEKEKEYKELIENIFNSVGADKWVTDKFEITRSKNYDREGFDSKGFRAEYPELYEKFKKVTQVKGGIRTKLL